MTLENKFSQDLDRLWAIRTAEIRSLVVKRGVGKPAKFTKRIRQKRIERILDCASEILVKRDAERELNKVVDRRHLWHVKGRGLIERGANLIAWSAKKLTGPIIYSFWRNKKCLYVGKGETAARLKNYEKSGYLLEGNGVEVFCLYSVGQLAKVECLATHLFNPRDQKVKPAKVKWGKKCPICVKHDTIRNDLNSLFRMR